MTRARVVLVAVLALLTVAVGVLTWTLRPRPETAALRPQVTVDGSYRVGTVGNRDAVRAAVVALPLALSYDYSTPETAVAAATSRMTADFAKEYRDTFDATVLPLASKEKAVTRARVRAAGVVRASGDQVTCLLYVDQVLASSADLASGRQPVKIGQNRVMVRMVRVGRAWKIDDITPL